MACCLTRKADQSIRLQCGNKTMWLTVLATRPGSAKVDIQGRTFTLYKNKSIQIGTNDGPIWIDLVKSTSSIAKLAIDAPPTWGIMRHELVA
jgi:sRNA-binding carbon storage regulator CsrA